MKFKTSLFRKGIILSDLKRFWWVGALYTLFLFFILPFTLLMQDTRELDEWRKEQILNFIKFTSGQSDFQIAMLCIVPVLLAVLMFRYLHVSKATAMFHSLPCDRKTLYWSHNAAGLLILVLPAILNGLVLLILQGVTYLKDIYTPTDILQWIGYSLLFSVLFYIFAVFVGMFTGNSLAQIAFTYILHVLPMGLSILLDYNLNHLLYGYGRDRNFSSFSETLPLIVLTSNNLDSSRFTAWHVLAYILLAALFLAAALLVYEKRKLESAGDIISFGVINPVFKYGVTFCTMLLGGIYFGVSSNGSFKMILFGYILCSLFGYCIAEMLIQKSFRVFNAYKGYLLYAAAFFIVFIALVTDVTGFIHHVPNPQDVQKVYFGYSIEEWRHMEKNKDNKKLNFRYDNTLFFESEDNIENLTKLHKQLTHGRSEKNVPYRFIIYTLKNGKHIIRQYPIDERKCSQYLKPVYESMEYKNSRFPVMSQKAEAIKFIEINDDRSPKKPVIISRTEELQEFSDALRKDISGLNYETLILGSREYINIMISDVSNRSLRYTLRDNYSETLSWLKSKGYYENIALLPSEIEAVTLERIKPSSNPGSPDGDSEPRRIEVKDRKVIEELFRLCSAEVIRPERRKEDVVIIFNIKGSPGHYQYHEYINKDFPVSDNIKAYFKQLGV